MGQMHLIEFEGVSGRVGLQKYQTKYPQVRDRVPECSYNPLNIVWLRKIFKQIYNSTWKKLIPLGETTLHVIFSFHNWQGAANYPLLKWARKRLLAMVSGILADVKISRKSQKKAH